MATFLQLHLLTSYPPACLNRDDLNRPKTAMMGGVPRLRVSSQSLKRTWRTSDVFHEKVNDQMGIRSKEMGLRIKDALLTGVALTDLLKSGVSKARPDGKVSEKNASEWAWRIAGEFVDKKNTRDDSGTEDTDTKDKDKKKAKKSNVSKETLKSEQIVFYSRKEIEALTTLIQNLREVGKAPIAEQLSAIKMKKAQNTVDLALFGRMLASSPDFNVEAACQVAHAITVHRAAVEDDYFTAVDDLNMHEEDTGSAHIGEQGFGAGLFYSYVCLDCNLLSENLGSNVELTQNAIKGLVEAAATVAPSGKQNSFAHRAWAPYVLAEKGNRQPRGLSLAFMKPVTDYGEGMLVNAVTALETMRTNLDRVYYQGQSLDSRSINALKGEGDFNVLLSFASDCRGV